MTDSVQPRTLPAKFCRAGLDRLWVLKTENGLQDVVTHIALGRALYSPTGEETQLRDEFLRVPILDTYGVSSSQYAFYATALINQLPSEKLNEPVGEIGFLLSDGTMLAVCSFSRPETYMTVGVPARLIYSLKLDAVPAGSMTFTPTEIYFNVGVQRSIDDLTGGYAGIAADALELRQRDIAHDEEIVSAKSRLTQAEQKLSQTSSALPAISKRIDDASLNQVSQQKELLRLLAWKQATDSMYIRARGWSGLLAVRQYTYHGGTDNLRQIASSEKGTPGHIHNHPEFGDLLGTGEVWAVINGWHFKARHRDHHLESPAPAGTAFLATQKLLPPALPPSVTGTVAEQTTAIIDLYRRYAAGEFPTGFRADLTALEVWLEPYSETFSDTFHSQRHSLQTSNLTDALRGLLHYSASGLKDRFENQSVEMPLVAWIDANGDPKLAILRYRMICTSLESMGDVRQYIKAHEDAMFNIGWGRDSGRFQVVENQDSPGALDTMMSLLPGLNGAGATLAENHTRYGKSESIRTWSDGATPINAAYYNRFAQAMGDDAANRHHFIRGDYDPYLFVASNTRPDVLDMAFEGNPHRWSWAIPMEIVIRHPFESWNPYNIPTVTDSGNYSTAGTQANPIRGLNPAVGAFFMTPADVYSGASHANEADTATGEYWVTCGDGVARKMRASGIWIKSPPIAGVGSIRLRYPIHPEHQEGDKAYAAAVEFLARVHHQPRY